MNWLEFWERAREPFEAIGPWGPAVFLVALMFAAEFVFDSWIAPKLREKFSGPVKYLTESFNGARTGLVTAVFAGATTLEIEQMALGAIVGVLIYVVKTFVGKSDDGDGSGGSGVRPSQVSHVALIALTLLTLGGCGADQKSPPLSADAVKCIALAEFEKEQSFADCRKAHGGKCNDPDDINRIMDVRKAAGRDCFPSEVE